jgi:hypothetical protein
MCNGNPVTLKGMCGRRGATTLYLNHVYTDYLTGGGGGQANTVSNDITGGTTGGILGGILILLAFGVCCYIEHPKFIAVSSRLVRALCTIGTFYLELEN